MAITEKLIVQEAAAEGDADPNIMLDLNAGDVDSYDGDGDVWYDIHDFEFKPTTNVSEHFNTVLFQSNNQVAQSITGVGFQPDLILGKTRQDAASWDVIDSVRGGDKFLSTDRTYGQSTGSYITSFDTDGFTLGTASNFNYFNNRQSVAFCFNAGGNEVTNTEGTIDSTVRANNDLGFSVVKYSGNGVNATVGHGLDVPPELTFTKRIGGTGTGSNAGNWVVGSGSFNSAMYLNTTAADNYPTNYFFNGVPSSTVINFKNDWFVNGSNNEYITYCFASKRGVSKVGSYEGTGTSGNKIYTGFEPAFVMVKNVDDLGSWLILDNVRDTDGVLNEHLYANLSNAEATASTATITPNRDGFTIGNSNSIHLNRSGDTFIYLAFAKNTNETSLISSTDLELNLEADSYSGSGDWLDSSGNGNNGTITGATHNDELGDFFEFDGSDYVQIEDSTSENFAFSNQIFTQEYWLNIDDVTASENGISAKRDSNSGSGLRSWMLSVVNSGAVRFLYYNNSLSSQTILTSNNVISSNTWHHIVVSGDGSSCRIYVDGDLVNTTAFSLSEINESGSDLDIGRRGKNSNSYSYLNGKIGQVRFYNSELSQAQIRQNYNFTKPKYPNEFHGDLINMDSSNWNASGYFDFDGSNDKVTLPTSFTNTFDQPTKTISMWVNSDDISSGFGMPFSMVQSSLNYGRIIIQLAHSNKSLSFLVGGAGSYPATTISPNTWYHLAVSIDGSSYNCFVNGSSIGTGTNDNYTESSSNNTTIGAYNVSNIYHWNGKISKVRAYNKALTQAEITALYNEGE